MGQLPCLVFAVTIRPQTAGDDDMASGISALASDRTLQPAQLALYGNPQVLDQVQAIGDLLGLWSALTRCGSGPSCNATAASCTEAPKRSVRQSLMNRLRCVRRLSATSWVLSIQPTFKEARQCTRGLDHYSTVQRTTDFRTWPLFNRSEKDCLKVG